MAYTEARKRANRKYNENNYDRVGLYLTKKSKKKETWQAAAAELGVSLSEMIITAVDEYVLKKTERGQGGV